MRPAPAQPGDRAGRVADRSVRPGLLAGADRRGRVARLGRGTRAARRVRFLRAEAGKDRTARSRRRLKPPRNSPGRQPTPAGCSRRGKTAAFRCAGHLERRRPQTCHAVRSQWPGLAADVTPSDREGQGERAPSRRSHQATALPLTLKQRGVRSARLLSCGASVHLARFWAICAYRPLRGRFGST